MKKDYGSGLRKFISLNMSMRCILDFGDIQVFDNVTNYTGIFILSNNVDRNSHFEYHKYKNIGGEIHYDDFKESLSRACALKDVITINANILDSNSWNFQTTKTNAILDKLRSDSKALSEYVVEIFEGIASGKDEVFYIDQNVISNYYIEKGIIFPLLKGRDIKAYVLNWSGSYVIYPYDINSKVYSDSDMKKRFPNAFRYLMANRQLLSGREYFDKSNKQWFELWNQRKFENFKQLRIVTPEISDKNNFMTTDMYFGNTKTYHIILKDKRQEQYLALLALLNSKLMDYTYKLITTPHAGGFYAYKSQFLNLLPINNGFDNYVDSLAAEVRLILKAKQSNPTANLSVQEDRINRLVYQLYELTPEEIDVVAKKK
jgi:hypothetical protein